MREIISLHVGKAGNRIGEQFWKLISFENGVDWKCGTLYTQNCVQTQRLDVFFDNSDANCRIYARGLFIDTEPHCFDDNSPVIKPGSVIGGEQPTGNNYAIGYFSGCTEMFNKTIEGIRDNVERCDSLQGFQLFHSLGGGTGSGLTAFLMKILADEYNNILLSNYMVFPSSSLSNITDPYNAVLGLQTLIEHSHLTYPIDNDALMHIYQHNFHQEVTDIRDCNHIIALTISGITASLRFPGQLNDSFRKIYVNMVPYPMLHFLIPGFAPLQLCNNKLYSSGTVEEVVHGIFSSNNLLCSVDFTKGHILTGAALFRGRIPSSRVEELIEMAKIQNRKYFVDWIPHNFKTSICDIPASGVPVSATFLGNTSAVTTFLHKAKDYALNMYERKAHLHWYLCEGLEEQDFEEAFDAVDSLIEEYESNSFLDCETDE